MEPYWSGDENVKRLEYKVETEIPSSKKKDLYEFELDKFFQNKKGEYESRSDPIHLGVFDINEAMEKLKKDLFGKVNLESHQGYKYYVENKNHSEP